MQNDPKEQEENNIPETPETSNLGEASANVSTQDEGVTNGPGQTEEASSQE